MLPFVDKEELRNLMNSSGGSRAPFYFITDFLAQKNLFIPKEELSRYPIEFDFDNHKSRQTRSFKPIKKQPISFSDYSVAFAEVAEQLHLGNSFLVNLTQPSRIEVDISLRDIYHLASAPYKLLIEDHFVVFSPESFVTIRDGLISSYPMKGTISAQVPFAEEKLLTSAKEGAEHATIVDLIRNDLSRHAKNVIVKRFKYLERIDTGAGEILQMSSEIQGELADNHHEYLGDILLSLLPAGSISGAPKEKTLGIIKNTEKYDRGFYTGVAGYFDGLELRSFVMIRFIEQSEGLIFKSGGGITSLSDVAEEYQELVEKIYVPIF